MARRARLRRGLVLVRLRYSRAVEVYYRAQLLALVRRMRRELETPLVKLAEGFAREEKAEAQDTAHALDAGPRPKSARRKEQEAQLWGAFRRLASKVERSVPRTVAQRLASEVAKRVGRMVTQTLVDAISRTVRLDVTGALLETDILKHIAEATAANVSLITSLPTSYVENLQGRLLKDFAEGRRWETLAKEIERSGEVTESRAKLIARDQNAKMTAAVSQARQQQLGGKSYQWQTSLDELVRDTHRENQGQVFEWSSPPPETGHPGDDVNCRCIAFAIFVLSELLQFPEVRAAA